MRINCSRRVIAVYAVGLVLSVVGPVFGKEAPIRSDPTADAHLRIVCWFSDGAGMYPNGDLEGFLVDRLGATGDRVAVEPGTAHAILRLLGMADRSAFDPRQALLLARAADADWVVWVKTVSRNVESKKLLSVPFLLNRWRLNSEVFFDIRVFDATVGAVIGSKRLSLTARGDASWQIVENERLDPSYKNDPVELHERMRQLDWRAASAISGYCSDLHREAKLRAQVSEARTTAQLSD